MSSFKIRLMIAEDHQMFRQMLASALAEAGYEIIGTAANGIQLLELLKQTQPELLVLDLRMPEMDGLEVLNELLVNYPQVKTLILSSYWSDYEIACAIIAGVRAYLSKKSELDELLAAIPRVVTEGYYFNAHMSRRILEELGRSRKLVYVLDDKSLTAREVDILRDLCQDLTISQIADKQHLSESTVRFHKNALHKKTDCRTLVSLIRFALRQGIVR